MSGTGEPSARLSALDGLRGICAVMILILHMPIGGPILRSAFVSNCYLFVDFFFVLSGYVISRGYAARLGAGLPLTDFLWRRFTTIYPLYLLMLILFAAMNIIGAGFGLRGAGRSAFTSPDDPAHLLFSIAMVQNWCGDTALVWNVPGWSVAVEMAIYLACGGLMSVAGRALPLAMLAVLGAGLSALLDPAVPSIAQFDRLALARCGYGFATGYFAFLAETAILPRLRALPAGGATLIESGAAAVTIAFVWLAGAGRLSLAAPILFCCSILVFAAGRGWLSRLAAAPPVVRIGAWSYAVYISHFFLERRIIQPLTHRIVPAIVAQEGYAADLLALALVPALLAAAWFLTRHVQQPACRLLHALPARLATRGRRSPQLGAQAT